MRQSCWDILGIAPTPDAAAIRRAYAAALKTTRPDEDADAFQRLVAARTQALAWDWQDPDADDEEADAAEDGVTATLTEAEFAELLGRAADASPTWTAVQPERAEPLARFETDGPEFMPRRAEDPLATLLAALAARLDGERAGVWDAPAWRDLVGRAANLDIAGHNRLRRAVMQGALPRLPPVPQAGPARADDDGPAAVVELLEAAFAFSRDQMQLRAALGQAPALLYLGWLEHAARHVPLSRQTPAQQAALALVMQLTGTGPRMPERRPWNVEHCRQLLALLAGMPAGERDPCIAALLRGLTEGLPTLFDETVLTYGSGHSYAATVELIEAELHLDGAGLTTLPPGAVLPAAYRVWLQAAARLRAVKQRRERKAYHDANGLPVLPPEDREMALWADGRFMAYWTAALRLGRWPPGFDWQTLVFPFDELAANSFRPGLVTVFVLGVGWLGTVLAAAVMAHGPARHWLAASCFAVLLLGRVPLAFVHRRYAVLCALGRVRRADREGVSTPDGRAARIAAPAVRRVSYRRAAELSFLVLALWAASGALTWRERAEEAYQSALTSAARGDQTDARNGYTRALEFDPDNARAVYGRGVSFYASGLTDDALRDLDRAVALDPRNADAFASRALTLLRLKRLDEALRDNATALTLRPRDKDTLDDRGLILEASGDRAKAIEAFDAALDIDPRFGRALVNRGRQFSATGDTARALADFAVVLGDPPAGDETDRESALVSRGWAQVDRGRYDLAIADYTAVATVPRWKASALVGRGYARFYAGAFPEAAEDFATALRQRWEPYTAVFSLLAQARGGVEHPAAPEHAPMAATLSQWPGPVIQMLLGQITPEAMEAAATTADQRCEVAFYRGQWALLHRQPVAAEADFRTAAAQCPPHFVERRGATAELARLSPPSP